MRLGQARSEPSEHFSLVPENLAFGSKDDPQKLWADPVLGKKMLFKMYEGALYIFLKFVAVLFKIASNCKQPKYASVGECSANHSTSIQGNATWP